MPKNALIAIHIVFWLANLTISFFLFQIQFLDPDHPYYFWKYNIITWLISLALFYGHYSILIPRFLFTKRYLCYAFFLTGLITAGFVLLGLNWNEYVWEGFPAPVALISKISYSVFSHVFAGGALRMLDYFISSEKKKQALKEELKKTELTFLKSQMSPHFLFNTLNNIYSLSLSNSENTSKALNELKDLMTYINEFKNGEPISIEEEIVHLKSFIALNDLRYGCKVRFRHEIKKEFALEPLLLLPFLENAYKHGKTDEGALIEIVLSSTKQGLYFSIENEASANTRKDKVGGIGIKNIQRRLELIYGLKHKLTTSLSGNHYTVSLTLGENISK